MKKDVVEEAKWKNLPGKSREWRINRGDDRLTRTNNKREQSIGLLQKRYGYTKEKAAFELDEHYRKAILW